MNKQSNDDRIWQIIEKTHICMFVSNGDDGLRARPLDARPSRGEEAIYFLTDKRGSKDDEIERDPHVCIVFIEPEAKAYLSLTGHARVTKDAVLAKKYWKEADEVWWPGRENDPNLRVLRVKLAYAELWDGPADSAVAKHEFKLARETGQKPNLGEKRKVVVDLGR